jgi:hypothetical protein
MITLDVATRPTLPAKLESVPRASAEALPPGDDSGKRFDLFQQDRVLAEADPWNAS